MKKLFSVFRNFALFVRQRTKKALTVFNLREWSLFFIFCIVALIGALGTIDYLNSKFMVKVPADGGSFSEGIVGSPRFINPILAQSDSDRDVVELVFSGLMRKDSQGNIIPDLAETYNVSDDGLTYTFKLKDDLYFHNGDKVTSEDIVFTINQIKDPLIKSPKRAAWEGVDVEALDEKTVQFRLKQPFAGFIEYTTIGILPKNEWTSTTRDQFSFTKKNTEDAIGSGPYMISEITTDKTGVIKEISLKRFKKFSLGKPFIKKIYLSFFSNEDEAVRALKTGSIDQLGSISPKNAKEEVKGEVLTIPLPRIYALFYNQTKQTLFTDRSVVKAINTAIDKQDLINKTLFGYGNPLYGPLPENTTNQEVIENNIEKARTILLDAGWRTGEDGFFEKGTSSKKTITEKKGKKTVTKTVSVNGPSRKLSFTLTTSDIPELVDSANYVVDTLKKAGMDVQLKIYDTGTLNNTVIRPRDFELLLFGQVVSHPQDLYAFWHSSQRNDPGLNIALYASTSADNILDKALITLDNEKRNVLYENVAQIISKDNGAIFLYTPSFIYKVDNNIKGVSLSSLSSSSDRFADVYKWYKATDNVWKIFSK